MSRIIARIAKHLFAILFMSGAVAYGASWSVTVDDVQGLPLVTRGGAPALKSNYVFWGANWAWADTTLKFALIGPGSYQVTGRNYTLGFDLTSNVRQTTVTQMTWDFDLNAAADKANVIGGGLSFRFNLATFGAEMGSPALLPGNLGWTWGTGTSRLEYRFNTAPAALYFEPGSNKSEIRALFYSGSVPAGHTVRVGTLSLAGDMAFAPTTMERFGFADSTTWPTDIMDWRTSPVDLSFLNQPEIPAGKHGFLRNVRDQLVFQDGSTARFWGTNLAAYALFTTSKDGVRQQARRLSELGFNLVRIHHHDSPWVSPNVFGPSTVTNTRSLADAQLDRLDWWIKCLKDQGIYVWLDLHAMRYLKAGDAIDYFTEISKGKADGELRGFNYVNASVQKAMQEFNQNYLNHRNPYTGLRYKDDPAIMGLLVTNENDLTHHFGNALLPDKNVPQHNALYMAHANAFATTWGLSREATWHSWEYGPSKIFLNDLERRFNQSMITGIRNTGAKMAIATTNTWAGMPLSSLPALTVGNLIDAHAYGAVGELEKNPLYAANFVNWLAAAQVAGRPLSITEWNVEAFPAPDRHTTPLYMASAARLQGWDAVMAYAYSQAALDSVSVPSNWHIYSDPSMIAMMPAAALLYRQGHVRESETVYAYAPTRDQLFNQMVSPSNSIALRTAAERGKLVIALPATRELPWLEKSIVPTGATPITNLQQSFIAANAQAVNSDTGQLRRDWGNGVYSINTPRTQAAMGWLGGKSLQLPDVTINVSSPPSASVAVQTLDGRPVATSRNLLISLGARSIPLSTGRMPYYSEPVEGRLSIRAPSGLKLYKRRPDGTEQQLPITYSNGSYVLNLDRSQRTYWLLLK